MAQQLSWKDIEKSSPIKYPFHYMLDIVKHKEWYDSHGVEQYIIIVVRDENISFESRRKEHCNYEDLIIKEEMFSSRIINDAIYKYILEDDSIGYKKQIYENLNTNVGKKKSKSVFSDIDIDVDVIFSLMPSNNRVILVSYETLMYLKDPYIKMLYEKLDIESEYMPNFKDGNVKYLKRYKKYFDR